MYYVHYFMNFEFVSFLILQRLLEVSGLSVYDVEKFLEHENVTLTSLDRHIEMELKRVEHLKIAATKYKQAINYGKSFGVDNPIQFYLVMKDVVKKWDVVKSTISANIQQDILTVINDHRNNHSVAIPTDEDLDTARVAIRRLQEVYNVKHEDIVEGKLVENVDSELTLDAKDCFDIGLLYYNDNDYNNTYLWMEQALIQLNLEQDIKLEKLDILKYMAYTSFKTGRSQESNESLLQIMSIVKDDESFYHHLQSYNKSSVFVHNAKKFNGISTSYKNLCRGENLSLNEANSSLFCYYKMDRPFLRLAPLKLEVLHLKPDIFLFHQVISNETIDILIGLAKNKLKQALVGSKNGTGIKSSGRTAKNFTFYPLKNVVFSARISYEDHEIISVIDKRISDMTNLDALHAEPLQIANYDVGGHYAFHYDANKAYTMESNDQVYLNDRIATVLFYLSTPIVGGATGFPKTNLSVNAAKNDAIFWHNLLKNGHVDFNTFHGGCPVLSGQKWIANKWIGHFGQMFLRKCSLKENE